MGEYDQTPDQMAEEMKFFVEEGWVNIIGGCRGTTDEYIARFPALATQGRPHVPAGKAEALCLSGLEQFELTPEVRFVNVGERCNVAGSRKFLRLVKEKNYEEALEIAHKHGRRASRCPAGDGAVPEPVGLRAGDFPCARHDRFFQMGRDYSRTEMRAGQEHRQFHLVERRRGSLLGPCPGGETPWGCRYRDGL